MRFSPPDPPRVTIHIPPHTRWFQETEGTAHVTVLHDFDGTLPGQVGPDYPTKADQDRAEQIEALDKRLTSRLDEIEATIRRDRDAVLADYDRCRISIDTDRRAIDALTRRVAALEHTAGETLTSWDEPQLAEDPGNVLNTDPNEYPYIEPIILTGTDWQKDIDFLTHIGLAYEHTAPHQLYVHVAGSTGFTLHYNTVGNFVRKEVHQ